MRCIKALFLGGGADAGGALDDFGVVRNDLASEVEPEEVFVDKGAQ